MMGTMKTSSGTATQKTFVLLSVKKVLMATVNALMVTEKFGQEFAESANKTRSGSTATVSLLVESMNSTNHQLKNVNVNQVMDT